MTWVKGQSGNPKGRIRGRRDTITNAFLKDMEDHWRQVGPLALQMALEKDPAAYVKIVASLVPRDVNLNVDATENFVRLLEYVSTGRAPELAEIVGEESEQPAPVRH